jgi:hypothetical protein
MILAPRAPAWSNRRLYQIQAAFQQVRVAQRAQDEPASTGADE